MRKVTWLALGLCVAACTSSPEGGGAPQTSKPAPTSAASGTATSGAASPKPAPTGAGEIGWDVPKAWSVAENPSSMRIATYKIPKIEGDSEDAELAVSRAGGSLDANLDRWKGQFDPAKPDSTKRFERDIAGLKVTIFEIAGTYKGMGAMGGGPGGPKTDYAMLAAIVEGAGTPWFFKMTGPEKTVKAARPDFESLVNSVRPK